MRTSSRLAETAGGRSEVSAWLRFSVASSVTACRKSVFSIRVRTGCWANSCLGLLPVVVEAEVLAVLRRSRRLSPAKVAVRSSKTFSVRPPVLTFSKTVATADLLVSLSSSIAGMLYVDAGWITCAWNLAEPSHCQLARTARSPSQRRRSSSRSGKYPSLALLLGGGEVENNVLAEVACAPRRRPALR